MKSFLGVPIRYQGRNCGNLYFANGPAAPEFTEEDEIVVTMLADRVGVAMEVARLRQIEARERTRLALLAKAGPLLAEAVDYDATLAAVARLAVPVAADLSAIDIVNDDGSVRNCVANHADPEGQALLDRLFGTTPRDRISLVEREVIETGKPLRRDLDPDLPGDSLPEDEYQEILLQIGARSTMLAPLVVRGRVIGVLRLAMAASGRRYDDDDLSLASQIAHHAALAIEAARLYREARTAIRARDNLLAVVSHDLRHYLATICMSAELLAQTSAGPERRSGAKRVEVILRASHRMLQLIDSLRDATMVETGQLTVAPAVEDTSRLLEEARATFEPQAEVAALRLRLEIDERVDGVWCDRERFLQVVANLVRNAIRFTQRGGEIVIGARPAERGVCFAVSDTGSGIPGEQLSRVFERHWHDRRDGPASTGLGLFIAKGIVEAHRGEIWVESKVGVGTTFFFTLPTAPGSDVAPRSRR
jgi:signal transduction histidine kinase